MNDSEERRRELLRQTRKLYDDRKEVPAVHPRYGSLYHNLYDKDKKEEEENIKSGSFYIRLVVSILCFICFVYMDQGELRVADVDSNAIVHEIEQDFDTEVIREVWNNL